MAVSKHTNSTALSIEVQSGKDASGNATYSKKSFANVKVGVDAQNAYDVAEAIKTVLSASTRSYFLNVGSVLSNS